MSPALGGLDAGGEVEIGAPERDTAGVFEHGALEDAKGAGLAGVGGRVVDAQAAAAFGAEAVEGALPFDVGYEVGWFGAGGKDLVLEVGALGYEGADFFLLSKGCQCSEGEDGCEETRQTLLKISFSSNSRNWGAARSR